MHLFYLPGLSPKFSLAFSILENCAEYFNYLIWHWIKKKNWVKSVLDNPTYQILLFLKAVEYFVLGVGTEQV